jgi:hypothetical protein
MEYVHDIVSIQRIKNSNKFYSKFNSVNYHLSKIVQMENILLTRNSEENKQSILPDKMNSSENSVAQYMLMNFYNSVFKDTHAIHRINHVKKLKMFSKYFKLVQQNIIS